MVVGILYLLSIVVANIMVLQFGIVTIGPLMFPAGAVERAGPSTRPALRFVARKSTADCS